MRVALSMHRLGILLAVLVTGCGQNGYTVTPQTVVAPPPGQPPPLAS